MAHHNLTTKMLLQIFDLVSSKGKKEQGNWAFNGIRAWHDFDGYTCWLSYKDLTATLLFHGKLSVEYEHAETLAEFSAQCILLTNYDVKAELS
mgnify:CR=1 FL=1